MSEDLVDQWSRVSEEIRGKDWVMATFEACEVLDRLTRQLTWTSDRPTEDGWYWMRCPLVSANYCGFFRVRDGEYYLGYQFAGPIPEPTEEKE